MWGTGVLARPVERQLDDMIACGSDILVRPELKALFKQSLNGACFCHPNLNRDRIGQRRLASNGHAAKVAPVYAQTHVVVCVCLETLP